MEVLQTLSSFKYFEAEVRSEPGDAAKLCLNSLFARQIQQVPSCERVLSLHVRKARQF